MRYLILGHVSNKLLLFAKNNPTYEFFVYTNNLDAYLYDLPDNYIEGKKYLLDNIKFTTSSDTILDGVLWDETTLTVEQIDIINDYLDLDKEVFLGNLYCEELEQLLEYDFFLGNVSCTIPEKPIADKHIVKIEKQYTLKYIDYLDSILDSGYSIITIGDFQKLVDETKIKTYKLTNNLETDIVNLKKLFDNCGKSMFIPFMSNNDDSLTEYQTELLENIYSSYEFDGIVLLGDANSIQYANEMNTFDSTKYEKIFITDRILINKTFFGQYVNGCDGFNAQNDDFKHLENAVAIHDKTFEFVHPFDQSCILSKTYRKKHPENFPNPDSCSFIITNNTMDLFEEYLSSGKLLENV